jgi:fructose-bisphosphate aldolase, class II
MAFVSTLDILKKCEEEKYAVGAFNINGLDQISALIKRAEELRSPILITIPHVIEKYVPFDVATQITAMEAEKVKAPVGMHLSHGMTLDAVERALKAGFTSVMFDGSKLDYDENVRQTREAVVMGHSYGAAVEGELGALGSSFANVAEAMTDPALAKDYVEKTGVDILAVAIGNAHGFYKGKPSLDFERLNQIHYGLLPKDVYLTLHGGTGIPEDHVKRSIQQGITKICIYTDMCVEGKKNAVKYCEENVEYAGNYDIPELIGAINKGFCDGAQMSMEMFMSTGRVQRNDSYTPIEKPRQKTAVSSAATIQSDAPKIIDNHDLGPKYPSLVADRDETQEVKLGVYWHKNL